MPNKTVAKREREETEELEQHGPSLASHHDNATSDDATRSALQASEDERDWSAMAVSQQMKTAVQQGTCPDSATVLIYLAACRIVSTTNIQGMFVGKRRIFLENNNWSAAADLILKCESADEGITRIHEFMSNKLDTNIHPGLLELFTKADLYYVLSGKVGIASLEVAVQEAQFNIRKATFDACDDVRLRLLRVGLLRYREWCEHEMRNTDPYAESDAMRSLIAYSKALEPSDAALGADFFVPVPVSRFVEVWEKAARPASLDKVMNKNSNYYRHGLILMSSSSREGINTRSSRTIDDSVDLVDVLTEDFSDAIMKTFTTLAMSGEAGSGKTQSALALSRRSDVACVYMLAADLLVSHKGITTTVRNTDVTADSDERNRIWASRIVDELLWLESDFGLPMKYAPRIRKRLVIIVDEAGTFPELVQAMCSKSFSLPGPAGGITTLAEHLKIDRINLVVTGTGVSAIKAQCGSSMQHFQHVVMNRSISSAVMRALDSQLHLALPCFESFVHLTKDLPKGSALKQLNAVKQNPRMYTFFVEAVMTSPVFSHVKLAYKQRDAALSRIDSASQRTTSFMLTMFVHCYSEVKHCLSRALIRFKEVNDLSLIHYGTMKQVVFKALLFSCLKRDWHGMPDRELEAQYGILVDEAQFSDVALTATGVEGAVAEATSSGFVCVAQFTCPQQDRAAVLVVVRPDQNHRYAVSPAHTELALSMLGAEDVEWTRLGFERIVTEALCLHTMMALQAADTLIALAIAEYFDKAAAALVPTLPPTVDSEEDANKSEVIAPVKTKSSPSPAESAPWKVTIAINDISDAEREAKRTAIAASSNIPSPQKATLIKLFDYLATEVPKSTPLTTKVLRIINDRELEEMLGLLFNDEARDPMRSMKVRRWVDALRLREKSSNVAVLKTTLPNPGGKFKRVVVDEKGSDAEVVPSGWLLRELERRANEQLWHLFEKETNLELQVVVVAMMYQDAPGIDAVIAYGTCSRRKVAAEAEEHRRNYTQFKLNKLVKLQFKKRDKNTKRDVAMLKPSSTERLLLQAMGSTISPEDDAFDGWSVSNAAMEYCLVQRDSEDTAHCTNESSADGKRHECCCVINDATIKDALHPTEWSDPPTEVDRKHEQVTQCVCIL